MVLQKLWIYKGQNSPPIWYIYLFICFSFVFILFVIFWSRPGRRRCIDRHYVERRAKDIEGLSLSFLAFMYSPFFFFYDVILLYTIDDVAPPHPPGLFVQLDQFSCRRTRPFWRAGGEAVRWSKATWAACSLCDLHCFPLDWGGGGALSAIYIFHFCSSSDIRRVIRTNDVSNIFSFLFYLYSNAIQLCREIVIELLVLLRRQEDFLYIFY